MRSLESLSGPWAGRWVQSTACGTMTVRLVIADGRIRGEGADCDGDFEFEGRYWLDTASVELVKVYTRVESRPYAVCLAPLDYSGEWTGDMICGLILHHREGMLMGHFELWPERDADVAERSLADVGVPENVGGSGS